MECCDLLVVERKKWNHELVRRYALCPSHEAVPGDLVTLHGDPEVYEVTHTFFDHQGEYAEVAAAMNPVFYVHRHWHQGNTFSLQKEEGEILYESV